MRKSRRLEPARPYRPLLTIGVYIIFYLTAFFCLEQRTGTVHEIHFAIDAYIPFCEVFVIPYLMWFGYVAFTVVFLCFRDQEEADKLIAFLIAGMTIFIVISAVFPNGHHLRPAVFPRNNLFTKMIAALYLADTPTNVLPSIHVYNSIAVMIAVRRSKCFQKRKAVTGFMMALGCSIILSTVLIKQHSVLDVLLALMFSALMYSVCYKRTAMREKSTAKYWK